MNYAWFKLHHDLPRDIKLINFSPAEKWAWVVLLCLASQSEDRGTIDADDEDIAAYCEFKSTQDWLYFRDKLIGKGMLEFDGAGRLQVLHWDDRQHEKPSDRPEAVRKRVAEHRKRKKEQAATPCNADVTPQIREDKTREDKTREEDLVKTSKFSACEESAQEKTQCDAAETIEPPPMRSQPIAPAVHVPSAAERMEAAMRARMNRRLPEWRYEEGANGIKPDFCEYLRDVYLPKVPDNKGKEVDMAMAKRWVVTREKRGEEELIEIQYEAFSDWFHRTTPTAEKTEEKAVRDRVWLQEAIAKRRFFFDINGTIDQEKRNFYIEHREEIERAG